MTPRHLALVEDDPDLSTTLSLALERDGYHVARFATGREGLEGILDNPPDLVILDLNLPDLDGLGVCRELRETPSTTLLARRCDHAPPVLLTLPEPLSVEPHHTALREQGAEAGRAELRRRLDEIGGD